MNELLVLANGLGRRFETGRAATTALREATCVVGAGQRIALMGPSGSGKSTLLHLLGGLDAPTAGTVTWPSLGNPAELRPAKITDIFQGPSLLTPLSVIDNVRMPLVMAGVGDREATERSEDALETFGVRHLRDKLPEEISGGQSQRVAIARALVVRPRLILADEPTGQLDSATALAVLDRLLETVAALGTAIVVSTHDPSVASRLDHRWIMRDGVLVIPSEQAALGQSPAQPPPVASESVASTTSSVVM